MQPQQRDDLVRSTTPFVFLFLIPVFGLLLRLFNLGKKRFYVDDVAFISHLLSMGLIASIVLTPVSLGFDQSALSQFIWTIWIGVYFIGSYKRVYTRGYANAIFYGSFQFLVFLVVFGAALLLMLLYIDYSKV